MARPKHRRMNIPTTTTYASGTQAYATKSRASYQAFRVFEPTKEFKVQTSGGSIKTCNCGVELRKIVCMVNEFVETVCDDCGESAVIGDQSYPFWGCNICNYDLCKSCRNDIGNGVESKADLKANEKYNILSDEWYYDIIRQYCPNEIHFDDLILLARDEELRSRLAAAFGSAKTGSKSKKLISLIKKIQKSKEYADCGSNKADGFRLILSQSEKKANLNSSPSLDALLFELGRIDNLKPLHVVLPPSRREHLLKLMERHILYQYIETQRKKANSAYRDFKKCDIYPQGEYNQVIEKYSSRCPISKMDIILLFYCEELSAAMSSKLNLEVDPDAVITVLNILDKLCSSKAKKPGQDKSVSKLFSSLLSKELQLEQKRREEAAEKRKKKKQAKLDEKRNLRKKKWQKYNKSKAGRWYYAKTKVLNLWRQTIDINVEEMKEFQKNKKVQKWLEDDGIILQHALVNCNQAGKNDFVGIMGRSSMQVYIRKAQLEACMKRKFPVVFTQAKIDNLAGDDLKRWQKWSKSADADAAVARLNCAGIPNVSKMRVRFAVMQSDGKGGWNWSTKGTKADPDARVEGVFPTLHEANAACIEVEDPESYSDFTVNNGKCTIETHETQYHNIRWVTECLNRGKYDNDNADILIGTKVIKYFPDQGCCLEGKVIDILSKCGGSKAVKNLSKRKHSKLKPVNKKKNSKNKKKISEEKKRQMEWEKSGDCAAAMARLKNAGIHVKKNEIMFVHMHADGDGGWNWRRDATKDDGSPYGVYKTLQAANNACMSSKVEGHDYEEEEADYESGKCTLELTDQSGRHTIDWVEEHVKPSAYRKESHKGTGSSSVSLSSFDSDIDSEESDSDQTDKVYTVEYENGEKETELAYNDVQGLILLANPYTFGTHSECLSLPLERDIYNSNFRDPSVQYVDVPRKLSNQDYEKQTETTDKKQCRLKPGQAVGVYRRGEWVRASVKARCESREKGFCEKSDQYYVKYEDNGTEGLVARHFLHKCRSATSSDVFENGSSSEEEEPDHEYYGSSSVSAVHSIRGKYEDIKDSASSYLRNYKIEIALKDEIQNLKEVGKTCSKPTFGDLQQHQSEEETNVQKNDKNANIFSREKLDLIDLASDAEVQSEVVETKQNGESNHAARENISDADKDVIITTLKLQLEEKKNELKSTKDKLKTRTAELQSSRLENSKLTDAQQILNLKIETLRNDVEKLEKERSDLHVSHQRLEKEKNVNDKAICDYKAAISEYSKRVQDKEREMTECKIELTKYKNNAAAAKLRENELSSEIARLKALSSEGHLKRKLSTVSEETLSTKKHKEDRNPFTPLNRKTSDGKGLTDSQKQRINSNRAAALAKLKAKKARKNREMSQEYPGTPSSTPGL